MQFVKQFSDVELLYAITNKKDLDNAIRFLYNEHFIGINNYIKNNSGNEQDGEDIFQELVVTFIDLIQQNKFRGDSSVKTYLYAIVKFKWLNELKKRNKADTREKLYEKDIEIIGKETINYKQFEANKQRVENILNMVGDNCKKILMATYYDDASNKEILETMHYQNEQVLRNKKYNCLKALEKLLSENKTLKNELKSALTYEQ